MFFYQNKADPPPIFNFGDKVEFEIARGTNHARWDYYDLENINNDLGPSSIWAQGIVVDGTEIGVSTVRNDLWIYVSFEIEGMIGAGYAAFPKPTNTVYHEWQWARPGFLKKKYTPKCVCGGESIYGINTNLHSFWCEKKEIKKNK